MAVPSRSRLEQLTLVGSCRAAACGIRRHVHRVGQTVPSSRYVGLAPTKDSAITGRGAEFHRRYRATGSPRPRQPLLPYRGLTIVKLLPRGVDGPRRGQRTGGDSRVSAVPGTGTGYR